MRYNIPPKKKLKNWRLTTRVLPYLCRQNCVDDGLYVSTAFAELSAWNRHISRQSRRFGKSGAYEGRGTPAHRSHLCDLRARFKTAGAGCPGIRRGSLNLVITLEACVRNISSLSSSFLRRTRDPVALRLFVTVRERSKIVRPGPLLFHSSTPSTWSNPPFFFSYFYHQSVIINAARRQIFFLVDHPGW